MVVSIIGDIVHKSIGYGPASGEGIHSSCATTLKKMTQKEMSREKVEWRLFVQNMMRFTRQYSYDQQSYGEAFFKWPAVSYSEKKEIP